MLTHNFSAFEFNRVSTVPIIHPALSRTELGASGAVTDLVGRGQRERSADRDVQRREGLCLHLSRLQISRQFGRAGLGGRPRLLGDAHRCIAGCGQADHVFNGTLRH